MNKNVMSMQKLNEQMNERHLSCMHIHPRINMSSEVNKGKFLTTITTINNTICNK